MNSTRFTNLVLLPVQALLLVISVYFSLFSSAKASTLIRVPNNLGLVGYWSFEDATSTLATDVSGSGNAGALINGPLWVKGRFGRGLSFDGLNDYAVASTTGFVTGTSARTITGWVYPTTSAALRVPFAYGLCGSGNDGKAFGVYISTSDVLNFWGCGSADFSTGVSIAENVWSHIAVSYDGTSVRVYVNGSQAGSTTARTLGSSVANMQMGGASLLDSGNYYFPGTVDDLRVYNRLLSSTEIAALYSTTSRIAKIKGGLERGLITHWSLDDATSTVATDSSGSGNSGTLTSGPAWIGGKQDKALSFDGVNDHVVSTQIINTSATTISAWIKISAYPSNNGLVAGFINGYGNLTHDKNLYIGTDGKLYFYVYDGATKTTSTPSAAVPLNQWVFVSGTADGATVRTYVNGVQVGSVAAGATYTSYNVPNFFIQGATGNVSFGGGLMSAMIDDVRLYNRALSSDEISSLYGARSSRLNSSQSLRSMAGLVGFWSFNGADLYANAAYDRSGQNNTGTLTNGPVVNIGKVGQALQFDASNDYVSIGAPSALAFTDTQSFTIAVWQQPSILTNRRSLVSKVSTATKYIALENNLTSPRFIMASGGGTASVTASISVDTAAWHHVVAVRNAGADTVDIYVNGVAAGSAADNTTGSAWNDSGNWRIGDNENGFTSYFGGLLDEVAIFNRALTAGEVAQLYNQGR